MLDAFKHIKAREAFPRAVADYALVHLCAIVALTSSVLYYVHSGNAARAQELTRTYAAYYTAQFLVLSLIFPVVFFLHGFYTNSRLYASPYKRLVVLQGSIAGSLVYLAANYLVFPLRMPDAGVMVVFSALLPAATIGARELKNLVATYFTRPVEKHPRAINTKERILVVGGAGYIGSILVRDLLAAGYRVRVLDSLLYGYNAIESILGHPRLELMVGDCRNLRSVVKAVRGVGSIVHLAAIVGDPACEQDQRTALEVNYAATRMLIDIAKGNAVQRLIFASSCSVYGASECLCDERTEPNPISLYAETKISSERALLEAQSESFHPTVLRLATVFGESYRPRFDLVVNLLTAKALQDGLITIYNGSQWRPFLHVRDVARAIMMALHAPIPVVSGQIFNVGDSRLNYTLDHVAECVRRECPNTKIECVNNQDRRNYRVSFDKIHNRLGYRCTVTLEAGIRQMKEFFETHPGIDYKDPSYSNAMFLRALGRPAYEDGIDGKLMAAFAERKAGASHAIA